MFQKRKLGYCINFKNIQPTHDKFAMEPHRTIGKKHIELYVKTYVPMTLCGSKLNLIHYRNWCDKFLKGSPSDKFQVPPKESSDKSEIPWRISMKRRSKQPGNGVEF